MTKLLELDRAPSADQSGAQDSLDKPEPIATKCVSAHLPEDVYWRLKQLAAIKKMEMQTVLHEAANALFRENGLPTTPIVSTKLCGKKPPAHGK